MDPITIAMGLAQFAPGIIKLITGSDKAADVAGRVVDVAKAVTGATTGPAALAAIQADPAKVLDFQQAMGAQQMDFERMYLVDAQDARARDVRLTEAGHVNQRANMLAGGAVTLVIGCLLITVWATGMDDFAKATITLICGRSLGWVEQVFSFEFGTNRASKTKDDTINKLTK